MHKISFGKKISTCIIAGLVIGASAFRIGITYFRTWADIGSLTIIPLLTTVFSVIYSVVWHSRKPDSIATLAFWQGLIRYGVAFDLAEFGWAKIFHRQLLMPLSKLDLPYKSLSSADQFWAFFSHSYWFGVIIAVLQIGAAMLLLFHRTRLLGVFILLPVLANILLMDIFYNIGYSVVAHAAIMMAGILYFLVVEFERMKEFFFTATNYLPELHYSKLAKLILRLSIIYIPILLIAMHGSVDKYPALTGKYEVKQQWKNAEWVQKNHRQDSTLTVVYFDIKNGSVFEFNSPANRWNGSFTKDSNHIRINWRSPANMSSFNGVMSSPDSSGESVLTGMLGKDSIKLILQKLDH